MRHPHSSHLYFTKLSRKSQTTARNNGRKTSVNHKFWSKVPNLPEFMVPPEVRSKVIPTSKLLALTEGRGILERDALKGWRIPGQAGNVGRLMKGVCHGPFVGEVDRCETLPR